MEFVYKEVFEKVKNHLLKQNERSIDNGTCLYRDGQGRRCAIGCLIPDENYNIYLEKRNVHERAVREALPFDRIDEHQMDFLECLQWIHDKREVSMWEKALKELAIEHSIEY